MKRTEVTQPKRGEHLISYAYPTSPLAARLQRASAGCYAVTTDKGALPFQSYREALDHVATLMTTPQRWSMDHPLNRKYLDGIHAFERIAESPGAVSPVYVFSNEIRAQSGAVLATCRDHSRAFKVLSVARDQRTYADWMAGLSQDELVLAGQVNAFLHAALKTEEAAHAPV